MTEATASTAATATATATATAVPNMIKVAVHPLAIVNMSDQYTRISLGGSPLSVVEDSNNNNNNDVDMSGLLFGSYNTTMNVSTANPGSIGTTASTTSTGSNDNTGSTVIVTISDAKDVRKEDLIGISRNDDTEQQQQQQDQQHQGSIVVALHQAVYPTQKVVGWYRIVSSTSNTTTLNTTSDNDDNCGPTIDDLKITQQLYEQYSFNKNDSSTTTIVEPFIFALLQISTVNDNNEKQLSENNNDDDDDTTVLPLTLYQLFFDTTGSNTATKRSSVLVSIDDTDWNLETSIAERIAIERAIRDQPSIITTNSNNNTFNNAENVQNINNVVDNNYDLDKILEEQWYSSGEYNKSIYLNKINQIEESILILQKHVSTILIPFIQNTINGTIPYNYNLLRQVQCILLQHSILSSIPTTTTTTTTTTTAVTTTTDEAFESNKIATGNTSSIVEPMELTTITNDTISATISASNNQQQNQQQQSSSSFVVNPISSTTDLLQQLTLLSKTIQAVQTYTEHVRNVHEIKNSNSMSTTTTSQQSNSIMSGASMMGINTMYGSK